MNLVMDLDGSSDVIFYKIDSMDNNSLLPLAVLARERYGIPQDVFVRHCKRILVSSRSKYLRATQSLRWLAPIYFRLYYNLLKLALRFLPKQRCGAVTADVSFELWSLDGFSNYQFYKKIHQLIKDKLSISFAVNSISSKKLKDFSQSFIFFSRLRVNRKVVREVLKNEKYSLPKNKTGIDSYFLWSLFLRQYVIYSTQCRHLDIKVFVTAGDNYLSPLRYWLMKKSGIRLVISLQNGFRTDCIDSGGAYYNETDVYEVFSLKQKTLLEKQGCYARTWLTMGNILTLNNLDSLKYRVNGPILVIGHDFSYPIGSYNQDDFNQILEKVRQFSIKHKKSVQYKARTGSKNERFNFEKHLSSEWAIFDSSTNSYEAVASASVCINYISTLGIEAVGMGKRVLTFNLYNTDFMVGSEDSLGTVLGNTYEEFERKLLYLLTSSDPQIEDYFKQLRSERMLLDPDVFKVLAQYCLEAVRG